MSKIIKITRRDFLKTGALVGGGLILGIHLPVRESFSETPTQPTVPVVPNAFIRIGADDTVTIIVNHSEMGQGVYTSLPMLVAEELEADWTKIRVESAPVDPVYNHTAFGMQMTGGSSSVWSEYDRLRMVGAAAREMLITAAANLWKVSETKCRAEKGKIILDANQQAVFEIGDKYVIAYCTRVTEEGPAPMADVENDIRYNIIRDKKADLISSELKKMITPGKTLDDIARSAGVTVQEATRINFRSYSVPGAGVEPALIAASSVADQGIIAGPITGLNGVYLITVNNVTTSPGEDLKLLKSRLMSTFEMRGSYEAYDALRKNANVIDKRYKFY